jgi:hypothetical protein
MRSWLSAVSVLVAVATSSAQRELRDVVRYRKRLIEA